MSQPPLSIIASAAFMALKMLTSAYAMLRKARSHTYKFNARIENCYLHLFHAKGCHTLRHRQWRSVIPLIHARRCYVISLGFIIFIEIAIILISFDEMIRQ